MTPRAARADQGASGDHRRLWRPHHRLPPLRRRGITLLGRVTAARDGVLDIAPGLAESLAQGDLYYAIFLDMVDEYVGKHGLDLPEDPAARAMLPDPPCVTEPIRRLDLRAEDINAVIWATGYGVDFGWIDIPVFDAGGEPVPPRRRQRGAGPLFPWPAMAFPDEIVVPVRGRRRRGRPRRPYRRAALTSSI